MFTFSLTSEHIIAFAASFLLALIAGPILIPFLRRLKFGQTVRDDGPQTHLKKMGTPTIGGLIFIVPITLTSIYFYQSYPQIIPVLMSTLGFAAVGFIDDFIKVVKKRKDGLFAGQKTFFELIVCVSFAFYVMRYTEAGSSIVIPFTNTFIQPWVYFILIVLFMYFFSNAVNITDGLDGLCAGVTLVVAIFFTIVSLTNGEWGYIKVFSAAIAGGCLGFLAFNIHPAKVFMGDTGSLALGGALASIAVMMRMPLILFLVGGIYLIEALSVILQVASFKLTGKRIFKMAPIHHHFELKGWKETKVVAVFIIVTVLLAIASLIVIGSDIF
ncbi:phospho-N-acetylmuramoyl-pentapeptide-transferase [Ruminiclostridium papyrosolvens DSM 2782]|uniref:Phospho-N-acetylmuramoyl-pentapeptide-transferase n=1 Tax=Ruminiclostridium papyrosolvens DSM 2782 TaxID=588581 RepID=F1TG73_9FIRM|nr:phospho-N-acetylmuramoyl-pentapeptide-transferase [Ruminiclostridium papyrosolvens]EGD46692.1 phospho-N-acetylmuramoyl-pentapeptide-transferase [Ruminiclostridium papyrosolvens DSM 2782]WES35842.1 phospho-N-acetylmuramoyl-pentapeptide-transferase [Ruminiclostridium papyrosolvens DSM 2782]